VSFAYLVYASSWLKRYYPAAFCTALLNAQPMGFYSSHSLVQDARRHGVEIRTPDINVSGAGAILELDEPGEVDGTRLGPAPGGAPPAEWGQGGPAVRLGLGTVREVGTPLAERIVAERQRGGPFTDPQDLVRRVEGIALRQLEALATAGTWKGFGLGRREALWVAGALAETGVDRLDGVVTGAVQASEVPTLPFMAPAEEARADLWATGVSPEGHPTRFVRAKLDELGVVPSERLPEIESGDKVAVAGVVTHRQRPATAGGTVFVNLEDEGGLINVVVSRGCWAHHRRVLQEAPALLVRGRLEAAEGVINIIAQQVAALPVDYSLPSRDFR
jgi:error-prone DNA polymerase